MDTWNSTPACPHNLDAPLPSYETMIVGALQNVGGNRGATPKEIFNYMSEQWPLLPNFRPSASQALARAFKRGRLLKDGFLYSLNPEWTSGHTSPDPTARYIAKKPASNLAPRPPPPVEHATSVANDIDVTSSAAPFSPETKAIAQAIVSLLRPIAGAIQELAEGQTQRTQGSENESIDIVYDGMANGDIIATGLDGGSNMSTTPSSRLEGHQDTRSPTHTAPIDMEGVWPSDIISVDAPEASSMENAARMSLLNSLEAISKNLHEMRGSPGLTQRM